jgi:SAM-dependent methyltransferase
MKQLLRSVTPDPIWRWLRNRRRLRFGSFRRVTPVSRGHGLERGTPIDRYYIERFLESAAGELRGRVLEFADDNYTRKFGGDRVTESVVWHSEPNNERATIIGDLTTADHVPSNHFDCIICTQVLLCIYDLRSAMRTLHRLLKPQGTLLLSVPGIAQIARYDMDHWGDYWRFTTLSTQRLLNECFNDDSIEVQSHGNVLASIAFLHGMAQEELRRDELDHVDPDYQFIITARAVKTARIEPPLIETPARNRFEEATLKNK